MLFFVNCGFIKSECSHVLTFYCLVEKDKKDIFFIKQFLIQIIIFKKQKPQNLYKYRLPSRFNRFKYMYVGRQQQTYVQIIFNY